MELPKEKETYLPIYFLLDEFANMGKLPNFSGYLTTFRKRQVSCSLVLQDIEQLTNTYGKSDASTIINGGCCGKIFFSGLSLSTCQDVEKIIGCETVVYSEGSTHLLGTEADKVRDMRAGRPLLMANEIRTMKDNQAIFIFGNKKPVMLKLKPYYKNSNLLSKIKNI